MRKRIWFACLLAMSMTFAACGSKASTEVEQEDAATVQEDTPEAEEDTTQEEENTDTITPVSGGNRGSTGSDRDRDS